MEKEGGIILKRIIINGRFLLHRVTGVERYARELVQALDGIVPPGRIEMAVPPEAEEIPVYRNIEVHRIGRLPNRLWEHVSFPAYVKRRGGIALNLCNVAPLISPGIATVHDLKPIVHPEYYSQKFVAWYRLLFGNALRRSPALLTVSKFSAKEILRHYHIDPHRLHLIPDGWQHFERIAYDPYALERYGLQAGEYYFSMGSRDPGKNLDWVIESARRHPEMIYAVSGSINKEVFAASDRSRPNDKGQDGTRKNGTDLNDTGRTGTGCADAMPENVRLLGYVTDEVAKTLMRDCKAFLFPSLYEGFGMPPLEALSAGCSCVVVSDIPVMHEIFEDEAVYVNPLAVEDFVCREADAGKILAKYSWKKSAKKLLRILKQM